MAFQRKGSSAGVLTFGQVSGQNQHGKNDNEKNENFLDARQNNPHEYTDLRPRLCRSPQGTAADGFKNRSQENRPERRLPLARALSQSGRSRKLVSMPCGSLERHRIDAFFRPNFIHTVNIWREFVHLLACYLLILMLEFKQAKPTDDFTLAWDFKVCGSWAGGQTLLPKTGSDSSRPFLKVRKGRTFLELW